MTAGGTDRPARTVGPPPGTTDRYRAEEDDTLTTITAGDLRVAPSTAHDVVALRRRRPSQRSPFSEVVEARRQHTLQVAAVSTGILSVTVAASAAIVLSLSA
ncbi:hypothetical protein NS263_05515 [Curtobacterium oceanosedimentum]|uniref:Uncharacterized protein n=1 Tax=Curtobacterium oceanosedimentum TaxID=465820 RepID=A0A147DUH0_9MICO|nr:hypothetical protein NS263_05515 [Curtobacterium oceanosedimentum]KTR53845.1 hypothetical protein NS359_02305 [Curtobacterium oceanosedimentum]